MDSLAARLGFCVSRIGGKRALATASGVSEAQLYRYMSEDSAISAERLLAIAQAAEVDAGWLLTGKGQPEMQEDDLRPAFRSVLLTQIIQAFEELLEEYDKPFTPPQRALAVGFIYEALRHTEKVTGTLRPRSLRSSK